MGNKKALKRRVVCESLPERDAFGESILSTKTDEDQLRAAANQPGRHRYRQRSGLLYDMKQATKGGTA